MTVSSGIKPVRLRRRRPGSELSQCTPMSSRTSCQIASTLRRCKGRLLRKSLNLYREWTMALCTPQCALATWRSWVVHLQTCIIPFVIMCCKEQKAGDMFAMRSRLRAAGHRTSRDAAARRRLLVIARLTGPTSRSSMELEVCQGTRSPAAF